jgi:hypothetical protein
MPANIELVLTPTQAYHNTQVITTVKSFTVQATDFSVIYCKLDFWKVPDLRGVYIGKVFCAKTQQYL